MKVAIFAVDLDGNFGREDGSLPWSFHNKQDMQHFRSVTLDLQNIVLGSKTYQSFGNKPLPDRNHYVVSSQAELPNCTTVRGQDFWEINRMCPDNYALIGGVSILEQALVSNFPFDYIFVTTFKIHAENCDIKFDMTLLDEYTPSVIFEDEQIVIEVYTRS